MGIKVKIRTLSNWSIGITIFLPAGKEESRLAGTAGMHWRENAGHLRGIWPDGLLSSGQK